jgi:hypothetical protein
LIAVPMSAVIGVLARHLLSLYLASPFYRGSRDTDAEAQIRAGASENL